MAWSLISFLGISRLLSTADAGQEDIPPGGDCAESRTQGSQMCEPVHRGLCFIEVLQGRLRTMLSVGGKCAKETCSELCSGVLEPLLHP